MENWKRICLVAGMAGHVGTQLLGPMGAAQQFSLKWWYSIVPVDD